MIITDMGSQLTKAGKLTGEAEPGVSWSQVKDSTAVRGIRWYHAPAVTAWRNGKAEAMVKGLKKSLKNLKVTEDLTYPEFEGLLYRAANCINQRPLGVRHFGGADPDIHVVTPNLMLLGSRCEMKEQDLSRFEEDNSIYTRRLRFLEKVYVDWWNLWFPACFDSLLPLRKWKREKRNMRVGDVCVVLHEKKVHDKRLTPAKYRYARVVSTKVDSKGLVRTVRVKMMPRDSRVKNLPAWHPDMYEVELPVQRLVVLQAAEDLAAVETPMEPSTTVHGIVSESKRCLSYHVPQK